MATELVLWDWNGTLLDDVVLGVDSLNRLLARFGYPQQYDLKTYREIFGFPIREYYIRAGFDFSRHSFEELAEVYMDDYVPASAACGPAAGAVQTLETIRAAGIPQVILSASRVPTLQQQVTACCLSGYFKALLGLDDIYGYSKVELGRQFMARTGIDPACALMVGDTLHDAEVAAAMGCRCVLTAAGHQSRARLETAGVPVVEALTELPAYLQ